jgi:mercuric ion transport protein
MRINKIFSNSAVVTALLASLCCITPVLAILGGISGVASIFSFLDPLRPYLIGLTVMSLGMVFYQAYKPKKVIDCDCEVEKLKFINSKSFLWTITLVSILLLTFPYYSEIFIPENKAAPFDTAQANLLTAKLNVIGMTCEGCELSVNYVLQEQYGVLGATSSYEDGIATVRFDSSMVSIEQLKKSIEESIGYKVQEYKINDSNPHKEIND